MSKSPHILSLFQFLITPIIRQKAPRDPWSKPRTIIRRLTTKFNPRTFTSSQVVPRQPSSPNVYSKENREAALRERGLLPPLRRNKDLSDQEKEQDRAIPIVLPKDDDQRSSTETDSPSAADLIKREWEAKNRLLESNQLQRMNSFKFGGNFSRPATPIIQSSLSESADSAALDSQAQPAREPIPSLLAEVAIPHLPPSTLETVLPQVPISRPRSRPVTPLLDIPKEIAAYLFPLPPSPKSVSSPKFDLSSCPPSPTSVPLPRSPSLRSVSDTTSLRSSLSGALTPCPLHNRGTSLTPTPSTPFIALTPCAVVSSDDTTSSPLHKRTDLSVSDESESSCQPPSLDDNSGTTTDSILGTSESAAIRGQGRLGGLNIKTHEGSCFNAPVIVESPIEDSFLEEQYVVVEPTSTNQAELAPMSAPISGSEPRFTLDTPRVNKRGVTDPTNGVLNRKRSKMMITNPFKRGLSSAGYEDQLTTTPSGDTPRRRLSVKTSFSSLRRSVVGTLSRKASSPDRGAGRGKMNDTVQSPTSLGSMMEEEEGEGEGGVRKAVSPILYSRGHILMEASHIKDEESRRVTEMAFLT